MKNNRWMHMTVKALKKMIMIAFPRFVQSVEPTKETKAGGRRNGK